MSKPRVLLIGWDAADWKVVQPLLQAGQMPNLARLMAGGLHGNIATIYPVLSPMLWTSIATGKRAYKHGIHGFTEPLPDGSGVRPITLLSRKTKAVWNILNQNGHRSIVVGWWPSHPAEPLKGVMVSNHFPIPTGVPDKIPKPAAGTVHPPSLAASLGELRVNPMELSGEFIRLFVPDYERVDQKKDKKLHTLCKIISETMSVHAAATELLETQPWDFAAIYYCGIDHFGHGFMRYHPPRPAWTPEEEFEIYSPVVANAYRYHDAMLGTLLNMVGDETTVILMSDHGFHPDDQRTPYIPAEPAGPAVEHRHFGMLCLKGPLLRSNDRLIGASLLDICPTILTLFGLPPGRDMDGKVLLTAFNKPPIVEPIESWDKVPGDAGTHPPETGLDPVASAEAFKQLVELGYVEPPGPNARENVADSVRELKYNLARAYRDGNHCGEAAALAGELWDQWPREHRFGLLLADCLRALGHVAKRRTAIDKLAERIARYQEEAKAELAKRKGPEADHQSPEQEIMPEARQRRAQLEERKLRELSLGRPRLVEWLFLSQALMEGRHAEARRHLEKLTEGEFPANEAAHRLAGAMIELGDFDKARELLESVLELDPENPGVHAQLAGLHFQAHRFEQAVSSAVESLGLIYFQPGIHSLLGQALVELNRFEEAEKALRVALAQSPRHLTAHESLATLYRRHLNRPDQAFAHEGKALSLRNELLARRRESIDGEPSVKNGEADRDSDSVLVIRGPIEVDEVPGPFAPPVARDQIITVVSGLPRSGTSLMMQLLAAAGYDLLTDLNRPADEDNPLGYFEFEKAAGLARDKSWLPLARGKVVKIVAQLLPNLPRNEYFHVIFMQRDLQEVISSQTAMLNRQGRQGAELDKSQLMETYRRQLDGVLSRINRRPEMRLLKIGFDELLGDPVANAERLSRFLGGRFNLTEAARVVRPELRRQKRKQ